MKKLIFLIIITFSFGKSELFACSCKGQSTVKEEIKNSDAVLTGKIITKSFITLVDSTAIKLSGNGNSNLKRYPFQTVIAKYELIVSSIYKDKLLADTIEVYTGLGGGDCGIRFEIGKEYIIYGGRKTYFGLINNDWPYPKGNNIIWANICSRTTEVNRSEIDEIEKYQKKK